MKGFYSIWTAPYYDKHKDDAYRMSLPDLLVMILSALKWRQHSGPVRLYADKDAIKYIEELRLVQLFDDGIYELNVENDINPHVFWAAGKLFALRDIDTNAAMIDLDLIVWQNLEGIIADTDIYGIHREVLRNEIYPEIDFFKLKSGSLTNRKYNTEVLPLNTAFLYIKDLDFQHYYAKEAIKLMRDCPEDFENLKHMVFVEQRLLPILAHEKHKNINTMFKLGEDIGYQEYFTHIWGHKSILKYNYSERQKFIDRIEKRIKKDFPLEYQLFHIDELVHDSWEE